MMTVSIIFNNGLELKLKKIDSCYLGEEDNIWRFFNDLEDMIVRKNTENLSIPCGVEFDGDTVFVPHDTINSISFK